MQRQACFRLNYGPLLLTLFNMWHIIFISFHSGIEVDAKRKHLNTFSNPVFEWSLLDLHEPLRQKRKNRQHKKATPQKNDIPGSCV